MEQKDKKRKAVKSPVSEKDKNKLQRKARKLAGKYFEESSSEEDDRARTPSGTVINSRVQDIRGFFSPGGVKKHLLQSGSQPTLNRSGSLKEIATESSLNQKENRRTASDSDIARLPLTTLENPNKSRSVKINMSNEENNLEQDQSPGINTDSEKSFTQQLSEYFSENAKEKSLTEEQKEEDQKEREIDDRNKSGLEGLEQPQFELNTDSMEVCAEDSSDNNPEVMSVPTVMEMLRNLKRDLNSDRIKENIQLKDSLTEEIKKMKYDTLQEIRNQIKDDVKQTVDERINENPTIKKISSEAAFWRFKSEALAEICDRLYTEVNDLTTRIENLELNNSKKMVMITGLHMDNDSNRKQGLAFLNLFINEMMEIRVNVDDYYTLGTGDPKPIILILQSMEDKRKIMRAKKFLQGIEDKGNQIFINDYLPPTAQEKRRRESDIVAEAAKYGESTSYAKGGLCVNGLPYRKRVIPPTPKQIVETEPEELQRLINLQMKKGKPIMQDQSRFTAYTADVQSIEQIQEFYKKMKIIQPAARHLVCAYRIDNNTIPSCYSNDYFDDGEPTAGRLLMEMLQTCNITNKVIFVARKYGGIKMGTNRFTCYLNAAKNALGMNADQEIPRKPRPKLPNLRRNQFQQKQAKPQAESMQPQYRYDQYFQQRGNPKNHNAAAQIKQDYRQHLPYGPSARGAANPRGARRPTTQHSHKPTAAWQSNTQRGGRSMFHKFINSALAPRNDISEKDFPQLSKEVLGLNDDEYHFSKPWAAGQYDSDFEQFENTEVKSV